MLNTHYFIALILLPIIGFGQSIENSNPSAQEIINRYIEVIGGEKKLKKIKTLSIKSEVKAPDYSFFATSYTIAPDKMYVQSVMGEITATTIINSGKGIEIIGSEKNILEQSLIDLSHDELHIFPYLYFSKWNYKMELIPDSKVDGKECYVIMVTGYKGVKFTMAFEKKSGLMLLTKVLNKHPYTYKITKYDRFDGILYPSEYDLVYEDGTVNSSKNTYVRFNEKIKKELFKIEY